MDGFPWQEMEDPHEAQALQLRERSKKYVGNVWKCKTHNLRPNPVKNGRIHVDSCITIMAGLSWIAMK